MDSRMEYRERIRREFDRGLTHGRRGLYRPGSTFGAIRMAYLRGYKEGRSIKALTDFKQK
jgi:hypothetical protein